MKNELRTKIAGLVRKYYEGGRGVPPVRRILRESGLSRRKLYSMFPRGIAEICELAGVPPPRERITATERATARSRERGERFRLPPIRLPSELSGRLLAASHVEGENNPIRFLDKMLCVHLELAKRGFKIRDAERLFELAIKAKETGIQDLHGDDVRSLKEFLLKLGESGWEPAEFVDYATANEKLVDDLRRCLKGEISLEAYIEMAKETLGK